MPAIINIRHLDFAYRDLDRLRPGEITELGYDLRQSPLHARRALLNTAVQPADDVAALRK
jgi:hypothetical protein